MIAQSQVESPPDRAVCALPLKSGARAKFVKRLEDAIVETVALKGYVDLDVIRERFVDINYLDRQVLVDFQRSLKVIHNHVLGRIHDTSFDTLYDIEMSLLDLKSVKRRDGSKYDRFQDVGLGSLLYHPAVRLHHYVLVTTDKVWNTVRRYASLTTAQVLETVWPVFAEEIDITKVKPGKASRAFRGALKSSARQLLEAAGGFELELADQTLTDKDLAALLGIIVPNKPEFWDTVLCAVKAKRQQGGLLGIRIQHTSLPAPDSHTMSVVRAHTRDVLLPAIIAAGDAAGAVQAAFDYLLTLNRVHEAITTKKGNRRRKPSDMIQLDVAPVVAALALDADPCRLTETAAAQELLKKDGVKVLQALVKAVRDSDGLPALERLCALEARFAEALHLRHASWAPVTTLHFIHMHDVLKREVEGLLFTTGCGERIADGATDREALVVNDGEILRVLKRVLTRGAECGWQDVDGAADAVTIMAAVEAELMRVLGCDGSPFFSLGQGSFAAFVDRCRPHLPAGHLRAVFGMQEAGPSSAAHAVARAFAKSVACSVEQHLEADVIARSFSGLLPQELMGHNPTSGLMREPVTMTELSVPCILPLEAIQHQVDRPCEAEGEAGRNAGRDVVNCQTGALDFEAFGSGTRVLQALRALNAAEELRPLDKATRWDEEQRHNVGPLTRFLRSLEVTRMLRGSIPYGVADQIARLRVLELPGWGSVRVDPARTLQCLDAAIASADALRKEEDMVVKTMSVALGLLMADRRLLSSIRRKLVAWLERWPVEEAGRVVIRCIMALPEALQGPFGVAVVTCPWMKACGSGATAAVVAAAKERGVLDVATLVRLGRECGVEAWATCGVAADETRPLTREVTRADLVPKLPVIDHNQFVGARAAGDGDDGDMRYLEIASYDAATKFVRDIWEEYMGANRNQRIVKDYSSLLKRLSDDLYSEKMHFIFELIQNAEDNSYATGVNPKLDISLRTSHDGGTELVFSSNEKGFLPRHVEAICRTDYSTKVRDRAGFIGHKGIGFKSVFKVSDRVRIHSRFFHFELDAREDLMGMITPTVVDPPIDWDPLGHRTDIVLELGEARGRRGNLMMAADVRRELEKELDPSLLLFLPKLQAIRLSKDDGSCITIERNLPEDRDSGELGKGEVETLRVERGADGSISAERRARYFRYIHTCDVPSRLAEQRGVKHNDIVLLFPQAATVESMLVHAFLPVNDYGFRFLLHSTFELASARNTILEHNEWNECIREELCDAMHGAVMAVVQKAMAELTAADGASGRAEADAGRVCELLMDVFCRLPLPGELKSFFARNVRLLEDLRNERVILTEMCTFVAPRNAVLAPKKRASDDNDDNMAYTRHLLQSLGYSFIHPGLKIPDRLGVALGLRRLDEHLLVELLLAASSTWLSAHDMPLGWLVHVLKELSREDAGYSHQAIQQAKMLPLADGAVASLSQGTVFWLPPGEFDGLMSRLSIMAMPRVLHPRLAALLTEESDAARMLRALGVIQANLHHIATQAILPSLGENRAPDEALLIMTTFTDHLVSGCRACEGEMEALVRTWKAIDPLVLCEDATVRRLSEGIHLARPAWLPQSLGLAVIDSRHMGLADARKACRLEELWASVGAYRFLALRKRVTTLGHLRRMAEQVGLDLYLSHDGLKAIHDDTEVEDWFFSTLAGPGDVERLRGDASSSNDRRRMADFARALHQNFDEWKTALTASVLQQGGGGGGAVSSSLRLLLCGTAWVPYEHGHAFLRPLDVLALENRDGLDDLRHSAAALFPVFPGPTVSPEFAAALRMSRQPGIRHFLATLRNLPRGAPQNIGKLSDLYLGLSRAINQDPEGAIAARGDIATLRIFVPHQPKPSAGSDEDGRPPQRRMNSGDVQGTFYEPKDLVLFDKGDVFDSLKAFIGERAAKLIRTTAGAPRVLERYYVGNARNSEAVLSRALLEETFAPLAVRHAPEPEDYLCVLRSFCGVEHEVEYVAPFYLVMLCLAYLIIDFGDQDEMELAEQTGERERALSKDEVLRRVLRWCSRDGPDAPIFPTLSGRWRRLSDVKFFTQHESVALVKLHLPPMLKDVTVTLPDPAWRINRWHKLPPLFDKLGVAPFHASIVREVAVVHLEVPAEEMHAATLPVIATLGVCMQAAAIKAAVDIHISDLLCERLRALRTTQVAALRKVCSAKPRSEESDKDNLDQYILESSPAPFYLKLAASSGGPLLQLPSTCTTRSLIRGGIADALADVIIGLPLSSVPRSALVDPSITTSEDAEAVPQEVRELIFAEFSSAIDAVDDMGIWEDVGAVADMYLGGSVPWFANQIVQAAPIGGEVESEGPIQASAQHSVDEGQGPRFAAAIGSGFLQEFLLVDTGPKQSSKPKTRKPKDAPAALQEAQILMELDLHASPPVSVSHDREAFAGQHKDIGGVIAPTGMGGGTGGGIGAGPHEPGAIDQRAWRRKMQMQPHCDTEPSHGTPSHVEVGLHSTRSRLPATNKEHMPIEDATFCTGLSEEGAAHLNVPSASHTDEARALAYWAEELVYHKLVQESEEIRVVWHNHDAMSKGDSMLPYDITVVEANGRTRYVEVKTRREGHDQASVPISLAELLSAQSALKRGDGYDLVIVVRPLAPGPVTVRRIRNLADAMARHSLPLMLYIG